MSFYYTYHHNISFTIYHRHICLYHLPLTSLCLAAGAVEKGKILILVERHIQELCKHYIHTNINGVFWQIRWVRECLVAFWRQGLFIFFHMSWIFLSRQQQKVARFVVNKDLWYLYNTSRYLNHTPNTSRYLDHASN